MKKIELQELGIDEETAKKVQKLYHRDRNRLIAKMQEEAYDIKLITEAINQLLPLIQQKRRIEAILDHITASIRSERKDREEAEKLAYYSTCEKCGAALDPGEQCDCEHEKSEPAAEAEKPSEAVSNSEPETTPENIK